MIGICYSFDLVQLVDAPTRIQGDTFSVLDLVFVSQTLPHVFGIEFRDGISDHKMVSVSLSLRDTCFTTRKYEVVKVLDFANADDILVIDYLEMYLF